MHYGYDPAGNLNYRTNNALIENFQVNSLNELTANTNGGRLTVVGTTTSQNANVVTVNSSNALVYGDATFAATNMPLTTSYTAIASDSYGRHSTNTVSVNIATNNAAFQYDGNGNLTNDGLRSFAYDDENQLIQVSVPNQWLSQFAYDGKMRRRIRQECAWQGGVWVQTNEVYYVYDGNEVIQERNINNLPTTTYTRGKDLSGSLEGAGGIGGLLSMTLNVELGTLNSNSSFYHSDGNGNVTMLINGSQAIVAKYLYDAFGNTLSAAGSFAQANLYRFSSKEAHPNSGLVYYLYRYYDPNLQRWPNRDPLGEIGNAKLRFSTRTKFLSPRVNLYEFVNNDAITSYDPDGLDPLGGCAAGAGIGGIGGAIGGFLSGLGSHCSPWKSAGCGALGGAINGCVSGAVCTTQPTWCIAASCLGGAAGNLAQQLCMGGGPSGTCGAISAAIDTAVGCLGGVAALSDSEKIALEQFLIGIAGSAIGSTCSNL